MKTVLANEKLLMLHVRLYIHLYKEVLLFFQFYIYNYAGKLVKGILKMKYLVIVLLILILNTLESVSFEFNGYLNKESLQLLVYSTNLTELEKIDLYKANIETIDQQTFKGKLVLFILLNKWTHNHIY